MKTRLILVTALAAWAVGLDARPASAQKMYWAASRGILRANLDGSGVEVLVQDGLVAPADVALDVGAGKMYWTDSSTGKIQRANLNGTNVEDLVATGPFVHGIALDVPAGKMYWTRSNPSKVQRANLDGSDVEDLVTTGLSTPQGIALDLSAGKMYWVQWGEGGRIQRANLDGSDVEDLFEQPGDPVPFWIALDVHGGKMYWTSNAVQFGLNPKIQRANLDGTGVEDLVTGVRVAGIALDLDAGKMYWTGGRVWRANLDGLDIETVLENASSNPRGLALDLTTPAPVPTASEWSIIAMTLALGAGIAAVVRRSGTGRVLG